MTRITLILIIMLLLPVRFGPSSQITPVSAQTGSIVFLPAIYGQQRPVMTGPGSWPMVAATPERTSFTATEVTGSLKAEWFHHFDAYISQKVQIIAADNKLFIAAADGLHALTANSGDEVWFFPTSLPPGNAPTYSEGVVYFGGHDRKLHALNANTGQELWSYTAGGGFETNPLVVNGLVLAGSRDGYFYAVRASSGQLAWRFKTGGAILYSAAYKDGVLYFASNDMYAYALNASDGRQVWKSGKLPGTGFYSWWPVIYDNYVVFSGSYAYRITAPFGNGSHNLLSQEAWPSGAVEGDPIGAVGTVAGDWAAGTRTIDASRISQHYEAYPQRRTTIVLNRSNGSEYTYDSDRDGRPEYAPFLFQGTHSGTRYPPAIGPDRVMYQSNVYLYHSAIPRGQITGWKFGTPIISVPTSQTNAGDEPMGYSIGGNTVYWKRCCDRTAGSFKLNSTTNTYYFDEGGKRLRRTVPELFQEGWDFAYWKHGDTSPPIPYNGRVYTINNNAVVAFSANGRDPTLPLDESRGSATGAKPDTFVYSGQATGLNTKVTFDNTHWPLLYQQERYFEVREEEETRANHFRIFEVAGSGGSPSSARAASSGITSTVTSTYSGGTLTTSISSRAPGLLFQNTGSTYQIRGSLAGIAYASGGAVRTRMGSASFSGSELGESWLLVWDSTASHRWMPMVISLQNRPSQVNFTADGLTLTFSGAAGYLGVTPLYGMSAPKSNEETTWRTQVPSAAANRARDLNRLLRAFPASASESMTINSAGDAEITYNYQYTTFSDAWNTGSVRLAYLPTHTALAAWNGSPIRVNGQTPDTLTDINFLTPLGRVAGVNNASSVRVTLPGIANVWRRAPGAPGAPSSGDPLQAKLVEEVRKILQSGHLLPAYSRHGIWDSKARFWLGATLGDYWKNPAETVYTLVRALPLLPADLQSQVRTYLSQEFAAFPTYSVSHVGWASGASRMAFPLPPEVEAARAGSEPCGSCNSWGFPPENHYASWMFAANFGNAGTIYNNTASKFVVNPTFQQSFSYSLNSNIAGHIGYLRLASLANAGAKPDAEKALVDMLVMRAALSKYPSALQQTGFEYGGYKWNLRTIAPNMPDTIFVARTIGTLWSQMPLYGFQKDLIYGLSGPGTGGAYMFGIDYVNLVPEVGSFLRTYALNEIRAAVADYEKRAPYWFVANAEEGAGEGAIRPIYDTIALFQAKSFILDASRAELERYLDVAVVPVGDLTYIQRLIIALEAGR